MTLTDHRLSDASAVAGNVWSLAAGELLHGLLRSHQCDPLSPAILRGSFLLEPAGACPSARRYVDSRACGHPAAIFWLDWRMVMVMSLVRPAGGGLTCWDVPRPDKLRTSRRAGRVK